jgi:hypothetical protein
MSTKLMRLKNVIHVLLQGGFGFAYRVIMSVGQNDLLFDHSNWTINIVYRLMCTACSLAGWSWTFGMLHNKGLMGIPHCTTTTNRERPWSLSNFVGTINWVPITTARFFPRYLIPRRIVKVRLNDFHIHMGPQVIYSRIARTGLLAQLLFNLWMENRRRWRCMITTMKDLESMEARGEIHRSTVRIYELRCCSFFPPGWPRPRQSPVGNFVIYLGLPFRLFPPLISPEDLVTITTSVMLSGSCKFFGGACFWNYRGIVLSLGLRATYF